MMVYVFLPLSTDAISVEYKVLLSAVTKTDHDTFFNTIPKPYIFFFLQIIATTIIRNI